MMHEESLKRYFEQEGPKGDLSPRQWERVLLHVKTQEQRRRSWGSVTLLICRRPLLTVAPAFVLAVMAVGVSLWVTAPWEGSPPGQPEPVHGPRAIPAPTYFDQLWKPDRSLITPGEPITISLTLKNAWDKRIEINEIPTTMMLTQVDTGVEEPIPLANSGEIPSSMQPGQEFTVVADVRPNVSADFRPGRYGFRFDIRFVHSPGRPEMGEVRMGLNSGVLFAVIPPEGALDKTVIVGQVREANEARITLETIHFTLEETTISVFAAPAADESKGAKPIMAPTPTSAISARGTPTPTAVPPAPIEGKIPGLTARYRIDGGGWHKLRWHAYRPTPEGTHHEWTFGPASVNADTFMLVIMSDTHAGGETTLQWEWTVALQAGERD